VRLAKEREREREFSRVRRNLGGELFFTRNRCLARISRFRFGHFAGNGARRRKKEKKDKDGAGTADSSSSLNGRRESFW